MPRIARPVPGVTPLTPQPTRPQAAAGSVTEPLTVEARAVRLARSMLYATLSYELHVSNRGGRPLENVRFGAGKPLESEQVQKAITAGEERLNGSGRIVVRASGTEPLIRIMAEGDDAKRRAFADAYLTLKRRIELFAALPVDKLDAMALQQQMADIGRARAGERTRESDA